MTKKNIKIRLMEEVQKYFPNESLIMYFTGDFYAAVLIQVRGHIQISP